MPFALLIIGIVLVVSAIKDTQGDLLTLVAGDFTGPGNFVYWVVALMVIGAVGYVQKLKPLSDGLLVIVLLVLVLSRGNPNAPGGGFFAQLTAQLATTKTPAGVVGEGSAGAAGYGQSYTGGGYGGPNVGVSGGGVSIGSGGVTVNPPTGVTIGGPGGSVGIGFPG